MALIDDVSDSRTQELLQKFSNELGQNSANITSYTTIGDRVPQQITYTTNTGTLNKDATSLYGKYLTDSEVSSIRNVRAEQAEAEAALGIQTVPESGRYRDVRNLNTDGIAEISNLSAEDISDPAKTRLAASGLPEGGQFPSGRSNSRPVVQRPSRFDADSRVKIADNSGLIVAQGGILDPLKNSGFNGVIFPYTPSINVSYNANYSAETLTHSNYEYMFYQNSTISDISITGTFTARNATEAAYVLATTHFFRSITKMFYGQDPERGLPPVVCRLSGHGDYQFNNVPVVITAFTQTYPEDVDYITTITSQTVGSGSAPNPSQQGATPSTPTSAQFQSRVPVSQSISISCKPLYSRSSITNTFGLKQFSNGSLLSKGFI